MMGNLKRFCASFFLSLQQWRCLVKLGIYSSTLWARTSILLFVDPILPSSKWYDACLPCHRQSSLLEVHPVLRSSIYYPIFVWCANDCFVGLSGVSYNTDDTSLREAFEKYGQVVEGLYIWISRWHITNVSLRISCDLSLVCWTVVRFLRIICTCVKLLLSIKCMLPAAIIMRSMTLQFETSFNQ